MTSSRVLIFAAVFLLNAQLWAQSSTSDSEQLYSQQKAVQSKIADFLIARLPDNAFVGAHCKVMKAWKSLDQGVVSVVVRLKRINRVGYNDDYITATAPVSELVISPRQSNGNGEFFVKVSYALGSFSFYGDNREGPIAGYFNYTDYDNPQVHYDVPRMTDCL